jgi:two-component system NtrC family sensor kinase
VGRTLGKIPIALIILAALILAGLGTVSIIRVLGSARPVSGVEWVQTSFGPIAITVAAESPAWAAGLRPGDYIEAVNDQPVDSAVDASSFDWTPEADVFSVLRIRRGTERLNINLRPGFEYRSEPYGYLSLVGFAFLFTGVFMALRWKAVRGASAYSLLAVSLFGFLVFSHTGRADILDRLLYWLDLLAGSVVPALLIQLALEMSRAGKTRRYMPLLYLPSIGILGAAFLLDPAVLEATPRFAVPTHVVEFLDRARILYLGVAVLVAAGLMGRAYGKSRSTLHRGQLRWMLWGLFVGLVPFTVLYAIPWALQASDLPAWAQFLSVLPMLLVPAAFTAALVRYRLHDVNLILRRVLVEAASVFLTVAAYGVVVYTLRHGLSDFLPISKSGSRYAGMILTAISYPRIRFSMNRMVEQAFFRKKYSYRATLLDWARELGSETDLRSLVRLLKARIKETLDLAEVDVFVMTGPDRFEIVSDDPEKLTVILEEKTLQRLGKSSWIHLATQEIPAIPWARYLFGMKVKGSLCAVLATSEREAPAESLSSEDRALLATFAAHAATGIESARLFEEVRKNARQVERLHAQQETILESGAVGLFMLDEDQKIRTWNRALEKIYGLPRTEAIGRTLEDVFPADVVGRLKAMMPAGNTGEVSRRPRYSLQSRSGDKKTVNISVSTASGATGEGEVRIVAFDDVTEQVVMEEKFVQQERLASLGMLAAGVAHEVNTPLTGISSYTQMLADDMPQGDSRQRLLEQIEDEINRCVSLGESVETEMMALEDARTKGAMALFGEKYPDRVRVVQMGDFSVELCGGTHLANTGQVGFCKIVSEEPVAAKTS